MTTNLIELIVQAIDDMFERTYQTNVWPNKADIKSALASIPKMPQVDLGPIKPYIRHHSDCNRVTESDLIEVSEFLESSSTQEEFDQKIKEHIESLECTCGLDALLTTIKTSDHGKDNT